MPTPNEILDELRKRFFVYHLAPDVEGGLLQDALDTYRDKGGVWGTLRIADEETTEVPIPAGFDTLIGANDADGDYVLSDIDGENIVVEPDGQTNYPVKIRYLYDLRNHDRDTEMPSSVSLGIFRKYLHALLNRKNTEVERMIHEAQGLQTQFPDDATLAQKIADIEQEIEETQPILPAFSVRG